jgi:hypothetical protein
MLYIKISKSVTIKFTHWQEEGNQFPCSLLIVYNINTSFAYIV